MVILTRQAMGMILCVTVLFMQPSCLRDSYRVQLSGPLTIGNEWIELRPSALLKAEKDFQLVVLDLEPPFKYDLLKEGQGANKGQGILLPEGEVINPEIQVIDQDGDTFNLIWSGATGAAPSPTYDLPYPNKLPQDREYKAVKIRSPRPIKVKAIYWFCESTKDWR